MSPSKWLLDGRAEARAGKWKWQTGMAGSSVFKTVLSLKMLFPLNVLSSNVDFIEVTFENKFPNFLRTFTFNVCFGATLGGRKMKLLFQTVFMFCNWLFLLYE